MITKQEFIDSCLKEVKVYKHLYTKIKPDSHTFKPTEKQRSIEELLRFIMNAFAFELEGIEAGKIGDLQAEIKQAAGVPLDVFPKRMDELAEKIKTLVNGMNEQKLQEEIDLFGRGTPLPRSKWLLELILKNMVGYKMQLFLYIKQTGIENIGTRDVWHGEDSK